jgi:restriction system protein
MAIPDFQTVMLPFLQVVADGAEHTLRDVVEQLADYFKLTEEERKELLPSGSQFTFSNRVGWARTYMSKAGLLESSRRGFFRITERGHSLLGQAPSAVNIRLLEQFPSLLSSEQNPEKLAKSHQ